MKLRTVSLWLMLSVIEFPSSFAMKGCFCNPFKTKGRYAESLSGTDSDELVRDELDIWHRGDSSGFVAGSTSAAGIDPIASWLNLNIYVGPEEQRNRIILAVTHPEYSQPLSKNPFLNQLHDAYKPDTTHPTDEQMEHLESCLTEAFESISSLTARTPMEDATIADFFLVLAQITEVNQLKASKVHPWAQLIRNQAREHIDSLESTLCGRPFLQEFCEQMKLLWSTEAKST